MSQNELQHHGVKGMKWGVRKRTQAQKTEEWKNKQIKLSDKKHGVDQWKKRADKAVSKFETLKNDKYATEGEIRRASRKATKQLTNYYIAKGSAANAKRNIEKMTLSDIRREQLQIGSTYVTAVAASLFIGPMVPGAIAGGMAETYRQANRGAFDRKTHDKIRTDAQERARKKIQGR